jgi:hypothetical protein
MNGLLLVSLDSGLLLFECAIKEQYGLKASIKTDPMQLSAMLYTIYSLSTSAKPEPKGEADEDEGSGIYWIRKVNKKYMVYIFIA